MFISFVEISSNENNFENFDNVDFDLKIVYSKNLNFDFEFSNFVSQFFNETKRQKRFVKIYIIIMNMLQFKIVKRKKI